MPALIVKGRMDGFRLVLRAFKISWASPGLQRKPNKPSKIQLPSIFLLDAPVLFLPRRISGHILKTHKVKASEVDRSFRIQLRLMRSRPAPVQPVRDGEVNFLAGMAPMLVYSLKISLEVGNRPFH